MDEPKFTEDYDKQVIICSTPKRKVNIKIYIPTGNISHWKIIYEDGRPIEGLSNGSYLTRGDAKKAVLVWELSAKKSKDAKQFELFGDKEPPVLARKKRVRGSGT